MAQQPLFNFLSESAAPLLAMAGAGAYHGLNPGMGWLFALSTGLQHRSERAVWQSAVPIAIGHTISLVLIAVLVITGARFLSTSSLQLLTALSLTLFGCYKIITYFRHPHQHGMVMGQRNLMAWSFAMAMAHGAGLMVAPALLGITALCGSSHVQLSLGAGLSLGIAVHTASMLFVMIFVAWIAYKKFGSRILNQRWINFDLIWAIAMLLVGGLALAGATGIV